MREEIRAGLGAPAVVADCADAAVVDGHELVVVISDWVAAAGSVCLGHDRDALIAAEDVVPVVLDDAGVLCVCSEFSRNIGDRIATVCSSKFGSQPLGRIEYLLEDAPRWGKSDLLREAQAIVH